MPAARTSAPPTTLRNTRTSPGPATSSRICPPAAGPSSPPPRSSARNRPRRAVDREQLIADHRCIETALDRLAASLAAGRFDAEVFRHAVDLCAAHYAREEPFLVLLHPAGASKMKAQHDEA